MSGPRSPHRDAAVALVLLALFVALLVGAVLAYPGGSWADPASEGYRPFVNYWCDLMRTQSASGAENGTASALAQAAFVTLAVALVACWRVAALLVSPRVARWGVACGMVASAGVVLVALSPYDTRREWHAATTLMAGSTGFAAAVLMIAGSLHAGPLARWRHLWGVALLAAAAANIAVYTDCVLDGGRDSAALPVIQMFATVFLVLWMATTALDARSSPPRLAREA